MTTDSLRFAEPLAQARISGWSLITQAPPVARFQQIDPAPRPTLAPILPGVFMTVTREPLASDALRISRARSDQAAPSQASLRRGPAGEVILEHIALGEGLTLESLPENPLIWLPADLQTLARSQAPFTQSGPARITRDGKPQTLQASITIRAIGAGLLPPLPATAQGSAAPDRQDTPLGYEWLLRIETGAVITARIECWYLPSQGLIHEARFIAAKVGPIRILNRREAWLRVWDDSLDGQGK